MNNNIDSHDNKDEFKTPKNRPHISIRSLSNDNYKCTIYQQLQELCCIFEHLNWPPLTYGSFVSARIRYAENLTTSKPSTYFMILIPPLKSFQSIKPTDMFICSVVECTRICSSLSLHKVIYDSNPCINFIIHTNNSQVAAVSSMKCGLLNISKERAMLGNVSYYQHPFDEKFDNTPNNDNSITPLYDIDNRILFLKCNGALCFGTTIQEAFHYALHLENACSIQNLVHCNQSNVNTNSYIDDNLFQYETESFETFFDKINTNQFFEQQYTYYLSQYKNKYMMCNNNTNYYSSSMRYSSNIQTIDMSTGQSSMFDTYSNDNHLNLPNLLLLDENHQPSSLHNTNENKINIPKCESSREEVLSYEFRSNLTSSPSLTGKNPDDKSIPRRRSKRFKAKRCFSLTSGVEKAIAKKLYDNNPLCDETHNP